MNGKNNLSFSLIGGILFAAVTVFHLITLIRFFCLTSVIYLIGYAAAAAVLILRRRDLISSAAFGILALASLMLFLRGFSTGSYYLRYHSYFSGTYYNFNFFSILPNLFMFAAYALLFFLAFCAMTDYLPKQKSLSKKIWFLPGFLASASLITGILLTLLFRLFDLGIWNLAHSYHSLLPVLRQLMIVTAIFAAGMWTANDEEDAQNNPYGMWQNAGNAGAAGNDDASYGTFGRDYQQYSNTDRLIHPQEGYLDLVKHVLLLIFTFGIWYLVWIYRMTGYLNRVREEEYRNPTTKLLLCIFVPFYKIYWVYQSARRIDRLGASRGISGELSTLCVVLAFFVGIIPPMLMQEKLNTIINIETGNAQGQSNGYSYGSHNAADRQQASENSAGFYQQTPNAAHSNPAADTP